MSEEESKLETQRERYYRTRMTALEEQANRLTEQLVNNYACTVPTYIFSSLPEEQVRAMLKKIPKKPRFTPEEREAMQALTKFVSDRGMDTHTYVSLLKVRAILEEDL